MNDKITIVGIEEKPTVFRFCVDPTVKPATIDIAPGGENPIATGIYALDKETLKICIGPAGEERPKEFSAKKKERLLISLQRLLK